MPGGRDDDAPQEDQECESDEDPSDEPEPEPERGIPNYGDPKKARRLGGSRRHP